MPKLDATVELHRGTIDPEGILSDDEAEVCLAWIEERIRERLRYGADGEIAVRVVGNDGRSSGVWDDGTSADEFVRNVVELAWADWCQYGAEQCIADGGVT